MTEHKGYISQIFQSIQGEGIYVGERQIFVRLVGCNMSCLYCDTPEKELPSDDSQCILSLKEAPQKIKNPLTVGDTLASIEKLSDKKEIFHSISFTGGEPLLQVDFLKELLPGIKMKKYLETNGTLPSNLDEVIENIDIIAMDFKLPSSAGGTSRSGEHTKFLEIAAQVDVFVKAVYSKETTVKEVDDMCRIIASVFDGIPLVLMPATASRNYKSSPLPDQALTLHSVAKKHLKKVLVIPQVHKVLGLP